MTPDPEAISKQLCDARLSEDRGLPRLDFAQLDPSFGDQGQIRIHLHDRDIRPACDRRGLTNGVTCLYDFLS
jgi:hypothetical protein